MTERVLALDARTTFEAQIDDFSLVGEERRVIGSEAVDGDYFDTDVSWNPPPALTAQLALY